MPTSLIKLLELAEDTWIPEWFQLFSDNKNCGFFERLDKNNLPLDTSKRLLSQCRQIIVYATAENTAAYRPKLDEAFQFIIDKYHNPDTGGSVFSLNQDGSTHDSKYDLYAHAFVILTCATYYKATQNKDALNFARATLNFIKEHFPMERGYAEALDKNLKPIDSMRRQNPHMHLMEACIYMYEISGDSDYLDIAHEMLELFYNYFLDQDTQTLREFFDNDLTPHSTEGHKIEAGHHAEWIWLLKRYQEVSNSDDPRIEQTMSILFTWIKTHGIDSKFGGVFNMQDHQGKILDTNKRIWCQFEVLRAASIITNDPKHQKDAQKIIKNLTEIIENNYIDVKTGVWNETLKQDLKIQTNHLPATTSYHIYLALKDSVRYLS
jgi:mannose-6-phosphate isomerase